MQSHAWSWSLVLVLVLPSSPSTAVEVELEAEAEVEVEVEVDMVLVGLRRLVVTSSAHTTFPFRMPSPRIGSAIVTAVLELLLELVELPAEEGNVTSEGMCH